MLMERDPILFFDEMTLYESELDDSGVMSVTIKVRVMPRCWFVLMRFWMRCDGVLGSPARDAISLEDGSSARPAAGDVRGETRGVGGIVGGQRGAVRGGARERAKGGNVRGSSREGRAERTGQVPRRGRGGVRFTRRGRAGGDGVSRVGAVTSETTNGGARGGGE